jgi:hypothetical protein
MASIDKTYTNSYKDYKEFKNWADTQTLTFFDGYKKCIGDYVGEFTEDDFSDGEIPIMNTPYWVDVYLIQNCKSKFVLDRMKEVYSEDSINEFKTVDLSSKPPKDFQQNRKITIKKYKTSKFPIHNKPYKFKGKVTWWLQSDDYFSYNDETKTWVSYDSYYPNNTNTAHLTSIKAIIRHLRKQYLPKGLVFSITGRYFGEEYKIIIS